MARRRRGGTESSKLELRDALRGKGKHGNVECTMPLPDGHDPALYISAKKTITHSKQKKNNAKHIRTEIILDTISHVPDSVQSEKAETEKRSSAR